jgi:hypothetical protein
MVADKHAGCKFTIGSITVQNHDRIAVNFSENQQNNTMTVLTATGTNSSSIAFITYGVHHGGVNSCHIDSLEVYRGRKKVIKINHDGFSIDRNGSIQVRLYFYAMHDMHLYMYRVIIFRLIKLM